MWDAAKKHMENAERACGRQMPKSVQHNVLERATGNGQWASIQCVVESRDMSTKTEKRR